MMVCCCYFNEVTGQCNNCKAGRHKQCTNTQQVPSEANGAAKGGRPATGGGGGKRTE